MKQNPPWLHPQVSARENEKKNVPRSVCSFSWVLWFKYFRILRGIATVIIRRSSMATCMAIFIILFLFLQHRNRNHQLFVNNCPGVLFVRFSADDPGLNAVAADRPLSGARTRQCRSTKIGRFSVICVKQIIKLYTVHSMQYDFDRYHLVPGSHRVTDTEAFRASALEECPCPPQHGLGSSPLTKHASSNINLSNFLILYMR